MQPVNTNEDEKKDTPNKGITKAEITAAGGSMVLFHIINSLPKDYSSYKTAALYSIPAITLFMHRVSSVVGQFIIYELNHWWNERNYIRGCKQIDSTYDGLINDVECQLNKNNIRKKDKDKLTQKRSEYAIAKLTEKEELSRKLRNMTYTENEKLSTESNKK